MKKLVLVAALVASTFAEPDLPTTAASLLSDPEVKCLIYPALKKECSEKGAELLKSAPTTVAMPLKEMGRRLAHMAHDAAVGKTLEMSATLPCELIEGGSVLNRNETHSTIETV